MTNVTLGRIVCGLSLSFLLAACVSPAPRGAGPSATGESTSTATRTPRPTFTSTQTPAPSHTFTPEPSATATPELSASQKIDAMLDAATSPELSDHYETQTNAGLMSLDIEIWTDGPLKKFEIPDDGVNQRLLFNLLGRLAAKQAINGGQSAQYPEFSGFSYNDPNYLSKLITIVKQRFANGQPFTVGILSKGLPNLYNYTDGNGGLVDNSNIMSTTIHGIRIALFSRDKFNDVEESLQLFKVPFTKTEVKPRIVQGQKISAGDSEAIAFMMVESGRNILIIVTHNEVINGQAYSNMASAIQRNGNSVIGIEAGIMASAVVADAFDALQTKSGGWVDVADITRGSVIIESK